jgi:RNase P subunit RPR2
MKDQMKILVKRIDYLYQKAEEVIDERSVKQIDFLLNEIDTNKAKLLELQIQEHYKELEDEND